MPSVTINSTPYDVYADIQEADEYLAASMGSSIWFASSEDVKAQALVTATRTIDRQCWLGTPTFTSLDSLAWPRTNTGVSGVEDDVVPLNIVNGSIELANLLVNGSDVQSNPTPTAQTLNIIKAGSVSLTYFRPDMTQQAQQDSRFPLIVQELVGAYMCGAQSALVGIATGTTAGGGGQSVTNEDYGYNQGI